MLKTINGGKNPTRATKYSAGIDLYANADITIGAGETVKIPLGVCIDNNKIVNLCTNFYSLDVPLEKEDPIAYERFLKSHYLQLEPRSSLRAKGLQSGTGIIDLDFKDEIQIIIHNPIMKLETKVGLADLGERIAEYTVASNDSFQIKKGDKIAQILLKEHKTYLMGFESKEERTGGFGSTGA